MSRATEDELDALHGELAKLMRDKLRAMKNGSEELNASVLSTIRQFLKDNHIEGNPTPSSPIAQLTEEFPFEEEVITH